MEPYYRARVQITDDLPPNVSPSQLYPGMPVETFINTGARLRQRRGETPEMPRHSLVLGELDPKSEVGAPFDEAMLLHLIGNQIELTRYPERVLEKQTGAVF